MQEKSRAGAQIGRKTFVQSLLILLALMIAAGILTRVVPTGEYARHLADGRLTIDPESFRYTERPDLAVWRWFTAPVEVLWGADRLTIVTIIIFLLMIGGSFAVLERCGVIQAAMARLIGAFGQRKHAFLLIISFFFMALGAFFGIAEEVIPLVPVMIAVSYVLGWDSMVGLATTFMATNLGFAAAMTNPFTIGVAQRIAGLPLFSGAWLRILFFLVTYGIFAAWLARYARRIEQEPQASPVYAADRAERAKYNVLQLDTLASSSRQTRWAMVWSLAFFVLIVLVLVAAPFIPGVSDLSLPVVGLLFLIGGLGAGFVSGAGGQATMQALWQGMSGIAPGIVLILMAASIKHIVSEGGVMDTILYSASQSLAEASPLAAALIVYGLALVLDFFVGSGSAKAFLMMPILLPLGDLVGVTRQTTVLAYCFGEGLTNVIYPTNPVLLVALGVTVVSLPKWLKWSLRIWPLIALVSIAFLGLAIAVGFGPF